MNALITTIGGMLHNTSGWLVLGAVLGGAGAVSTAHAHDDIHLDLDFRHGHIEIERQHWVREGFVERETRVWVEPVYQTVPGERVWVEPVYKTVIDRVWREPVTRDDAIQVTIPAHFEERVVLVGNRPVRERIFIPARLEGRIQKVVVVPGHYEDLPRQELVCEGHWQSGPDQQVIVTPGHWETRIERVPVVGGHWEERPLIRIH